MFLADPFPLMTVPESMDAQPVGCPARPDPVAADPPKGRYAETLGTQDPGPSPLKERYAETLGNPESPADGNRCMETLTCPAHTV